MMSSLNEWKAWLRTLRRIWDPNCSGTSNSSPGGPPTMWVRRNSSIALSSPLLCHTYQLCPWSWFFNQPKKAVSLIVTPFVPLSPPSLCFAQVSDWWEEYIYLRGRGPIMVNSNYYAMVRHLPEMNVNGWFSRAAFFNRTLVCRDTHWKTLP